MVGTPEGKKPRGRPRRRWEDNIRMDFEELQWEVTDWTDPALGRGKWLVLVNAVTKLWISGSIICAGFLD